MSSVRRVPLNVEGTTVLASESNDGTRLVFTYGHRRYAIANRTYAGIIRLRVRLQDQPALTDAQIEQVLTVHYHQVLASSEGRKLWRTLLRQAAAAEVLEQVRVDAR